MPRGKSQVKSIIPKNINTKEWKTMFMQMIGSDVDVDIVYPKYEKIYHMCGGIINNFRKFSDEDRPVLKLFPELKENMQQIQIFCDAFEKVTGELISYDEMKLQSTEDNSYLKLKNSNCMKNIIVMTKNLREHSQYLDGIKINENVSACEKFIYTYPGPELILFPFSSFDLKTIWREERMQPNIKEYILICLAVFYKRASKIVKLTLSADVDVKGFSSAVSEQLQTTRKQIKYCDKAFNEIERSINLLENNFDGYYRDMVHSGNPNLIVENFVLDVSKQGNHDPKVSHQFKTIIRHYRKHSQNKIHDPRLRSIFSLLDKHFALLDGDSSESDLTTIEVTDTTKVNDEDADIIEITDVDDIEVADVEITDVDDIEVADDEITDVDDIEVADDENYRDFIHICLEDLNEDEDENKDKNESLNDVPSHLNHTSSLAKEPIE